MEKRVSLETYGCTLNQADSDIIRGILEEAGYLLSPNSSIFILNTCAVKETTENKHPDPPPTGMVASLRT